MRVVFFASAFPDTTGTGIDMVHAERARALGRHASVVVVVPTPWVPGVLARWSARWRTYARAPRRAHLSGVAVLRPRYPQVPGSGPWAGVAMALGALGCVRRLRARGRCDVLYAQGIVPDGFAAVLLGRWTGTPVACLGRGSDVHGLPRSALARRFARFTVRRAAGVAVVARQLIGTLERLARDRPIAVLPNGIDLERFVPGDRAAARRALGIDPDARVVLYVGRLAAGKGTEALVDAIGRLRAQQTDVTLLLVGSGPLEAPLACRALELGIASQVRFAGGVRHDLVPTYMQASDVLAIASVAEGFPNVIREALACGRPVVATAVGDVPRVVTPDVGHIVPVGDAAALAGALAAALREPWDEASLRRRVADMTWDRNARATHQFLEMALCA